MTERQLYLSALKDYPDILSVTEVSQVLGVSTKTVYKLIRSGALTSMKVGKAFRVPKICVLRMFFL
jgi:excisionase family DNA binding protein